MGAGCRGVGGGGFEKEDHVRHIRTLDYISPHIRIFRLISPVYVSPSAEFILYTYINPLIFVYVWVQDAEASEVVESEKKTTFAKAADTLAAKKVQTRPGS